MSIRIKNQHGVIVNNVDGDQVVYGGQHGMVVTSEDAQGAIRDLLRNAREAAARADRRTTDAATGPAVSD